MANRRTKIIDELVRLIKENLDGTSPYVTNIFDNALNRLKFWDEVTDYPFICVYPGTEIREYLPGDFKWGFLTVNIRIYVQDEDPKERLEEVFEDLEALIDSNNDLVINGQDVWTDMRLLSISDDEGVLSPIGVGEITLEVRYQV